MFNIKLPLLEEDVTPGVTTGEIIVPDAEVQETNTDVTDPNLADPNVTADPDEEEFQIPAEHQTAFQKRLERETKKLKEKADQEAEQKYIGHKQVVDMLGGDTEGIQKQIRDNQLAQQAQQMAAANGWTEAQTQWYLDNQRRDREIADLRVQNQVNELRDNPNFAGITSMKKEIAGMVDRSNGALTVEQAYYALGGANLITQQKREAEQRELAKRTQARRTIQMDSTTSSAGTKPLPADIESQRIKLGLSEQEARTLLEETPENLNDWRKKNQKKK